MGASAVLGVCRTKRVKEMQIASVDIAGTFVFLERVFFVCVCRSVVMGVSASGCWVLLEQVCERAAF